MQNKYQFTIAPCDRPSRYRSESQCKTNVMNLSRQYIQKIIEKEDLDINSNDFKFYGWDFDNGFVSAVYNPIIEDKVK